MKTKFLASLLAAMFLGVSLGAGPVNAATSIVVDNPGNVAVNPPPAVNNPIPAVNNPVPGTVTRPNAGTVGNPVKRPGSPNKVHKPSKAHKPGKAHKVKPNRPSVQRPQGTYRPAKPQRPQGTYKPAKPAGKGTYVHGAHWCYGACSLHDAGQHNAPRTQKHWCDGYRR